MRKDYTKTGKILALIVVVFLVIFARFITDVDEMLYMMLIPVIALLIYLVSLVLNIQKDVRQLISQSENKKTDEEFSSSSED